MRKHLALLLAVCLAAFSCNPQGTYYVENANEFVTTHGGKLYNDSGAEFTVTQDASGQNWSTEGLRSYIVFDVQDRDYNIILKALYPALLPEGVQKDTPDEVEPLDPVSVEKCFVSGGFLNMTLYSYRNPASDFAHTLSMLYEVDKSGVMKLYLRHNGNNENPVHVPQENLVTDFHALSFQLQELVKSLHVNRINLYVDVLKTGAEGAYEVSTVSLLNIAVQ